MSATTTTPVTIDTSRPGVPMTRLIAVEARKLVDTRAGFWLVISMAIIAVLITTGLLIFGEDEFLTYGNMAGLMNIPTGFLLPVLAILLVTSEWGQRTALVTFTLEPRRERIVVAKLAVGAVAAIAATVLALALGAVGNAIAGATHSAPAGEWDMTTAGVVNMFLLQLFGMLMGFGFAMLLMNSAAAIVLYFVLPTVWSILAQVVPWLRENLQEWLDFGFAQAALQSGEWPTGDEWTRIATSGTLWLVLPLAVGIWRLLRSEVK